MNVKRYEWVACDEHACHCDVVESAEGDMVDYEDYAALEARCAALAAENAALKSAIQTHSESVHFCELCGKDDPCSTDDVCMTLNETPSTDTFLAEVRAQGVDAAIEHLHKLFGSTDNIGEPIRSLEWLAKAFRKGAAQ